MSTEKYITGTGQVLFQVHLKEHCTPPCVVHAPAKGPWNAWKTHWRGNDAFSLFHGFERICPCGVRHPAVEETLRGNSGMHACCGCPCSVQFIVKEEEEEDARGQQGEHPAVD